MRRLEEQLLSHDERMADEVKREVALAIVQQQQSQTVHPEPNVATDLSQPESNYASTEHPANTGVPAIEMMTQQRYPVDEITQWTTCCWCLPTLQLGLGDPDR